MKAIIRLDVPEWQIGQEVSVYFPDTMIKKSVCDADEIVRCKDCKYSKNHYSNDVFGKPLLICKKLSWNQEHEVMFSPDWFCADGEKKEE